MMLFLPGVIAFLDHCPLCHAFPGQSAGCSSSCRQSPALDSCYSSSACMLSNSALGSSSSYRRSPKDRQRSVKNHRSPSSCNKSRLVSCHLRLGRSSSHVSSGSFPPSLASSRFGSLSPYFSQPRSGSHSPSHHNGPLEGIVEWWFGSKTFAIFLLLLLSVATNSTPLPAYNFTLEQRFQTVLLLLQPLKT